jgi:glycosyltransferase involved in cell wall biosynthesis
MKVLQIIDSLQLGGAEHMAVNYANALAGEIDGSYLCCTRKEGPLKDELDEAVGYCFLNKSSTFDLKAYNKLKKYITVHEIDIVQAHSSSYFLVSIVKIFGKKKFKLIWHDHYGNSEYLKNRPKSILKFFSAFFDGIISVNSNLKTWAINNLKCRKVEIFKNFLVAETSGLPVEDKFFLEGENDFKFICVANFRPQKDHLNLIRAFDMLELHNVSLHLVGQNYRDDYNSSINEAISTSPKKDKIYYYGCLNNITSALHQADVGILSSNSEGLPVAILEYGLAGLPVICTDVGELKSLFGDRILFAKPKNAKDLSDKMYYIYNNATKRLKISKTLHSKIKTDFLASKILPQLVVFYKNL